MNDPLTEAVSKLTKYFNDQEIEYVFVGGISIIVLGRVRLTMDLDVIVNHFQLDIENFTNFLSSNGFHAVIEDFLGFEEKNHCNIFLKDGMFRVDFKGVYTDNDQRAIDMAIDAVYNDIPLKLNHPLNIVAYKLYFGSEQDYEDAIAVFVRNEEQINLVQLKEYCKKLGISNHLEDFLAEIEKFRSM